MIDSFDVNLIAEKYYKDIFSYCYSHLNCNETEASDITQEVFLLFQEKSGDLEDANISSWLYSVANNKIHEYFRKAKKEERNVPLDTSDIAADDLFALFDEYFAVEDEKIEKYKELIIKSLTKSEYELYNKIYVEKKKYKEIADELNTTEKAINLRALRLRRKIKQMAAIMMSAFGQFIIKMFF